MGVKISYTDAYQDIGEIPYVSDFSGIYYYITNGNPGHRYIELLDRLTSLNIEDIANWLNITPKTYRAYRKNPDVVLKDNLKEHLILLLSLYRHGIDVFGNKKAFEKWLTTANILLDNREPHQFLDTITGIKFIDNRLTAMEFGENM